MLAAFDIQVFVHRNSKIWWREPAVRWSIIDNVKEIKLSPPAAAAPSLRILSTCSVNVNVSLVFDDTVWNVHVQPQFNLPARPPAGLP